jgi:hypothetical protein
MDANRSDSLAGEGNSRREVVFRERTSSRSGVAVLINAVALPILLYRPYMLSEEACVRLL